MLFSFAAHGGLIGLSLLGSMWVTKQATEEGTKLTFIAPPPPPPPPPGGGGQKTKPKVKKVEPKKVKQEFVQPREIPKETPKVEEKPKVEDAPEEPGGQEGGVKGGVEGGVVGGVVGGVIGGTLGGELGGKLSYERVSKAPGLMSGEKEPPIPANLLPQLRGSKGVILVRMRINADGKVDSVEIVRSTIPLLDDIVRRHIMGWRFEPPMIAGRATRVEVLQPFSFRF